MKNLKVYRKLQRRGWKVKVLKSGETVLQGTGIVVRGSSLTDAYVNQIGYPAVLNRNAKINK